MVARAWGFGGGAAAAQLYDGRGAMAETLEGGNVFMMPVEVGRGDSSLDGSGGMRGHSEGSDGGRKGPQCQLRRGSNEQHVSVQATWVTQCPLLLLDTRMPYGSLSIGCEEHLDLAGTGSFFNEGEADIVVQHVFSLIHSGVSPNAIAVQSPYIAQVQLLRDRLDELPEASGVEVSTIDSFQGREADAVIISLVRSNTLGAVGFLGDSRRMNVAVTRARKHVAVVCDSSTICHNTFLARLLRHIRRHGRVKHAGPGSPGGSGLDMNPMLPSTGWTT